MSHLVYCIMREHGNVPRVCLPLGGAGHSVHLVAEQGLAAAVSPLLPPDLSPTVGRLQTFAAVVEALHATRTVLPMRYGCLLPTEGRVAALLRERGPEFVSALDAVEGCAEMTIRVMLDENPIASSRLRDRFEPPDASGGTAYLASRKAHYARQALSAKTATALGERSAAVFRGLFVRYTPAYSPNPSRPYRAPLLSLHFLVKRSHIATFRRVFEMLERAESAKMLLSGPWPPYHFVQPRETSDCLEGKRVLP